MSEDEDQPDPWPYRSLPTQNLGATPWPGWTGGPWRSPYWSPLQQDPIELALLPTNMQAPSPWQSPDRTEGFVRHWGVPPVDIEGPAPDVCVGPDVHVEDDPQRVRWIDECNCVRDVALATRARVWELARCGWPQYGVASLERIATFLSAQGLDGQGQPTGAPFVTIDNTPLCQPVIHPTSGEELEVRWLLRQIRDDGTNILDASPRERVPVSSSPDGLPAEWSDWRFSWQSRYTEHHRSILTSRGVRLFVQLRAATPAAWRVNVGGRLTLWWQATNAFAPEITRQGVTRR